MIKDNKENKNNKPVKAKRELKIKTRQSSRKTGSAEKDV